MEGTGLPGVLVLTVAAVSLVLALLYAIVRPRPIKIPIKGRHVFISGGSSGIGLALARAAVTDGAARVSIMARTESKLEEARKSIRLSTGVDVATFAADVRDYDQVRKAMEEAFPIDLLILSHGVYIPQELEKQSLDDVKFMLDVNLMGTFNVVKAALPMIKRCDRSLPSSIAFISSQAGQVGIYGYTAYSATKFGLRGFAEALQQEVIADNIHVSLIYPPDTETPGFIEEMKLRPELTNLIAGSSTPSTADEVAKRAIHGIKSGSFVIPCNTEGLLLALATAGLSPQRSFLMACAEVFGSGLLRLVGLVFQFQWYNTIEKWRRRRQIGT